VRVRKPHQMPRFFESHKPLLIPMALP
jgi:hypothetical protein